MSLTGDDLYSDSTTRRSRAEALLGGGRQKTRPAQNSMFVLALYEPMWNRLRYTLWAPFYDAIVAAVGFGPTRRRSIEYLRLHPGHRVLIIGAGTGLDLAFLPPDIDLTAVDVTPAMLMRLERRATQTGRAVTVRTMDARELGLADESFDAVIMHLILAVMPQPERGLQEAARVLRGGGRIAVFDKFVRDDERVSPRRRMLNIVAKPLFSDMNRRFGPLLSGTGLTIERDEPAAFGGMYRIITLQKPLNDSDATATRRAGRSALS